MATCPITGKKLGPKGGAYNVVVDVNEDLRILVVPHVRRSSRAYDNAQLSADGVEVLRTAITKACSRAPRPKEKTK